MQTTAELKLAEELILFTNKNVFLTGKAGTGKTTFLHQLKTKSPKRMAIVAPTGVAAINAGGVTIHSFFQLPFAPFVPTSENKNNLAFQKRFRKEKIKLLQSLDLLVIDEISMVRADLLDGIDEVLRRYRHHQKPFGGLQLLMIGDLFQLAPIVKDDQWELLRNYYASPYFFESIALKQTDPVTIELKTIFRQQDDYFISLLNKVRDNHVDHHTLTELNAHYKADFQPHDREGYIILTTHNALAQNINAEKLDALHHASFYFQAEVTGDFPTYNYPTDFELYLKVGAQVMFVKNDVGVDRKFFNGKIGIITKLSEEAIHVQCTDDHTEIEVVSMEWQNTRYVLDENNAVKEEIIGTFKQMPLRLAWAITIHKSQGLTFDKAIIDAQAAFAHGQAYVALSRCRSLEGMVLSSRLDYSSIKTDAKVIRYSKEAEQNLPDANFIFEEKRKYQEELILELFDLKPIVKRTKTLIKICQENSNALLVSDIEKINSFNQIIVLENEVIEKFRVQILSLFKKEVCPEENTELQSRIEKASAYFHPRLECNLLNEMRSYSINIDNKAVQTQLIESKNQIEKLAFEKVKCFKLATHGFNSLAYIQQKANAEFEWEKWLNASPVNSPKVYHLPDINHPELYKQLRKWRNEKASENDWEEYMVLPQKTMLELVKHLPLNTKELLAIKGMGKTKVNQLGKEIIQIIENYCRAQNIERGVFDLEIKEEKEPKIVKESSKEQSLQLYKQGKSIDEIAEERNVTKGTILNHLSHYIKSGEICALDFINEQKLQMMLNLFQKNEQISLSSAKEKLGDEYSYDEIKIGMAHYQYLSSLHIHD